MNSKPEVCLLNTENYLHMSINRNKTKKFNQNSSEAYIKQTTPIRNHSDQIRIRTYQIRI